MMNTQLELEIGQIRASRPAAIRQRRRNRAHWWFDQMRQVVDRAFDWQPAPEPPARQIWLKDGQLP
jgi:hypothetical protein